MTVAWFEGIAPVTAAGPPGADDHRLEWRAGEFVLVDHPDPDADEALGALGGDRCPCLDVLEAWTAQHRSASILAVGRRHDEELVPPRAAARDVRREVVRWRSHLADLRSQAQARGDARALSRMDAVTRPVERAAAARLGFLQLLTLPDDLQLRLQASVAARLAEAGPSDALVVATAARALPVLRRLGWEGGLADIDLVPDGGAASISAGAAVLPASWLSAVWARGVAAVGEWLVVSVVSVGAGGGSLEAVATTPGKDPTTIRVDRWDNGWRTT